MKIIFNLVLFFCGFCTLFIYPQQRGRTDNNSFTRIYTWDDYNQIKYLYFLDENRGYAVSSAPGVYKTSNGGYNWEKLYQSPYSGIFNDLKFFDSLNGYVAFARNYTHTILLKTTNGGNSWDSVFTFPYETKLTFTDKLTGYGVEKSGMVYKTTNGGKTWKSYSLNLGYGFVTSSYFLNSDYGWIAALGLRVYHTTNGGSNWDIYQGDGFGQLFSYMYFADSLNGLITNGAGEELWYQPSALRYTTDGGKMWKSSSYTKAREANFQFFMPTSSVGYAYETKKFLLLKTSDGGANWKDLEISSAIIKNSAVYFFNKDRGYIITPNNDLYLTTTGGEAPTSVNSDPVTPTEFYLEQNHPNPFNPSTKIEYQLPKEGYVKVEIFTIDGRLLKTITDGIKQAGRHSVIFSAENLNSGIYFYRLNYNGKNEVKKMLLVK